MGASYKAHCLVLKKTKLGETDLILTMLSDEGMQIRGVAKGARKPGNKRFGARLEPFSEVDVVLYPGRNLETITEVRCVTPCAHCREDLDKASACNLVCEFLDKCSRDGEVGERVFQLTCATFQTIDVADPEAASQLAMAHLLKAVSMIGFKPAIRHCAFCGSPVADFAHFNLSAGGSLCPDCAGQVGGFADAAVVGWVDTLLGSTLSQVAALEDVPCDHLLDFVQLWIAEHVGIQLKSLSFIRALR